MTYSNGEFAETDGKGVCDIISYDIVLKTNGDLVELSTEKVLMRDIIHSGTISTGYYAITRNGNINLIEVSYDGTQNIKQTGIKIPVREEWVSRLD